MPAFASAADELAWNQLPALPDALGLAAPFAGVSGAALIVAGGANFPNKMPWEGGAKVWQDRIWILRRPDAAWREAGKLPRALAYGVCVTQGDSVVCVGGSDARQHHAAAFRLVWNGEALSTQALPALPIALSGAAGALVGETVIVACGAEQPGEQTACSRAFALDLGSKNLAWRELPPLPGQPRLLATAAARDGVLYVFGGAALARGADGKMARVYLREAWSYRDNAGWQRLRDMPKPCVAAPSPAPLVDGKLLLLGGDDGSRAGFQPVEKHPGFPGGILAYDPLLDRWSEPGAVPAPRATVPCVEWRGAFVVPSGEARPGVRSPEVWSFPAR